jgi:serine/threonine protein kinase
MDGEGGTPMLDELRVDSTERLYDIAKPIGKGKFSTVYRATRRETGTAVALKKIAIFDLMDVKSREKCLKEIQLVRSLNDHNNIIKYLDGFIESVDKKELVLVFEYAGACRGGSRAM